ncbi:MAG TPA: FtsQ-type POTRA domain-containing protein [Thermoanaerobaculia bacterium]|nr:FtsQ-type POTRA domain-containing protein [Thermoanaerobaculia bacterium]
MIADRPKDAAATGGRVLDFRRRAVPPRRRRRPLLLALARPLAVAVVTVALPLCLGTWVLTSRRFQLRAVAVTGTQRVSAAWVRWALAPLEGRNLLRLPLAEVLARLAANPWIASAEVAKELPDRLRVHVAEKRPMVLLHAAGQLSYADAQGQPIAPVGSPAEEEAARRLGLLVVALARPLRELPGGIAGALEVAAELRAVRPDWAAALSQVEALGEEDYRLRIDNLPCPLLVRGGRVGAQLARFERLLPELTRRYPALSGVDLRFARRIVVEPAPAPAAPAGASQRGTGT